MVQSNNSNKNIAIDYEKENHSKNKLKKEKLANFHKPKKLENIFTEEDIKTEDFFETHGNESKNIKKRLNKDTLNKDNKKDKNNKNNVNEKIKLTKNKEHNHIPNEVKNIINNNYTDRKVEKNEKKKENNRENNIKTNSTKEIIKGYKYDDFKKTEIKLKNENKQSSQNSQNDVNKKKKKNRVKSVDNKLRKDNPACICIIY